MTVSTTANLVVYRGNGATTAFAVPFKVLDEDHLQVRRRVFATGEYDHTYVGTDYVYTGLGDSAGTLTLDGTALDDDYELVIERLVPYTQDLDIVNSGGFYPETVEEQLDLIVMAIQQLADLAGRGITFPVGDDGVELPGADSRALTVLGFASDGSFELIDAEDFQGDPGGNAMAIGPFETARLGLLTIDSSYTLLRTSGFADAGDGGDAFYIYDPTIDAAYLADNPLTSFPTVGGQSYRLAKQRLTPRMFGALGANVISDPAAVVTDQATLDASPDDTAALQAFFDFAFDVQNGQDYVFDWSGHWAVSEPLYFVRPLVNTGTLNVEYHARKFVCGSLHVLPVAMQPGLTAMDTVLTLGGPHMWVEGNIFIHDGGRGTTAYADRRFNNGVKIYQMTEGHLKAVTVFGAKRDRLIVDTQAEVWEVRSGTDYEAGSTSKNSIGLQIDFVYGAGCGSCNVVAGFGHSMAISAIDQGGDPLENGVFETTEINYNSSHIQRSKVTVDSTAEVSAQDFVKRRHEIPASAFTSIAANNGAGTLTLTAGDGVALGLGVGLKFTLVDGSGVGLNDGVEFEILAIGGGSNRTLTVYPKPTTEAAAAYTFIYTEYTLHRVATVVDATTLLVHPWIPNNGNHSALYLCQGYAVNQLGSDGASVQVGYAGSYRCGGGIRSAGLYGLKVMELLTDVCELGEIIGFASQSAHIGTNVVSRHLEATSFPLVQLAGSGSGWHLGDGSGLESLNNMILLGNRATSTSPLISNHSPVGGVIVDGGREYRHRDAIMGVVTGDTTLSNDERYGNKVLLADSATVTLDFDYDQARVGNIADTSLLWIDTDGTAPDGTLTFALSTELTDRGWTMTGTTSLVTPAKPAQFRVVFYHAARLVIILHTLVA